MVRVLITSLVAGILLAGCGVQQTYTKVPDVSKAPDFVHEPRLAFKGDVRFDLVGRHSWRSGSVGVGKSPGARPLQWRHVFPVVPPGWEKSAPIPLWISFNSNRENVDAEIGALRAAASRGSIGGRNVDYPERTVGAMRGKSAWQSAIEDACATHGIATHPRAPVISWRPQ